MEPKYKQGGALLVKEPLLVSVKPELSASAVQLGLPLHLLYNFDFRTLAINGTYNKTLLGQGAISTNLIPVIAPRMEPR